MGEVRKQSIQNSVVQYVGILLGYLSSVILFTNILDTDQFGLTRVLFALAAVYVNIGSLGTFRSLVRFFPFFKTKDGRHSGFIGLLTLVCLFGYLLATLVYISLERPISLNYSDSTNLLTENYYYVIFLSFLLLFSGFVESYLMALKKTVFSNFLNNIAMRIIWIGLIIMFEFNWFDFDTFILLYVSSNAIKLFSMMIYLRRIGEMRISDEVFRVRKKVIKVITRYGILTIFTDLSSQLINRIDLIMVTFLIGLSATSVYAIAVYISSVIFVPSRSITRIAMPIIADLRKKRKFDEMEKLYQKSSINMLLAGGFVFLCIWLNIDEIFTMLPEYYATGKTAVLILSISLLLNMLTGINNVIILNSNFYIYDSYASVVLAILAIVTNFLFIPILGVNGAAIATLISVGSYHVFKSVLIKVKMNMQPFTSDTLLGILVILLSYGLVWLIPDFEINFILRIILKCIAIGIVFATSLWFLNISPDINNEIRKYLVFIGILKK